MISKNRLEVGGLEAGGSCTSCMQERLEWPQQATILHQKCIIVVPYVEI